MDKPGGEIIVNRDLVVTARDGIGLATDVYRPAGDGPFPVLLERTPYDKSAPSRSECTAAIAQPRSRSEVAAYFVHHGYAVVYQDCRGRYKSGGRFTKHLSEAEDGCDTLAWLMRQSWCNGRVGTFGLSYAAHAQAALGCLDPPGWRRSFSIAAGSPTPIAAASAMAAPTASTRNGGAGFCDGPRIGTAEHRGAAG